MARRLRTTVESPGADAAGSPGMMSLVDLTGLALIAVRWWTPTEGTYRGDTLWISQLWLGWGVLAAWSAVRQQEAWSRRGGWWMRGLLLLVAGHLASGLAVVVTEGQKRAALNGLWEWIGLGLAAVWFHHRASSVSFRRSFRTALIATAVGLSALGIWQRWITQPELGRAVVQLDELEARLPALEGIERRDSERQLEQLRKTVGPEYTSLDDAGRRVMRQRLLESSEPLGRFALTNSFAALLMVSLLLIAGDLLAARSAAGPSWRTPAWLGAAACAVLVTFVLLLTKSRTAWAGTACGGLVGVVLGFRGRFRDAMFWTLVLTGGLGMLTLATWTTGGLDRLVVTEAPKSLEYRSEYWIGAARVIQEHPLFGAGPGNFRQQYLRHKLEKSSEEVLDPHNFLLESWTAGGLTGFIGLVLMLGAALAACRRPVPQREPRAVLPAPTSGGIVVLGAVSVLLGKEWLLESYVDGELLVVGVVAALAAVGLKRVVGQGDSDASAVELATRAAWCGLSVHLLGAGGMEMPAIIQLWLCLSSLTIVSVAEAEPAAAGTWPKWAAGASLAACGAAFVGHLATATTPVITSRTFSNLAEADSMSGGRIERIDERLAAATEADGFDPNPWRRRSQFAFQQWSRTREEGWFDRAVEFQREAIRRDPANPHEHRALAQLHLNRFASDRRPADAEAAVSEMETALRLYPNHVTGRRQWAEALEAAERADEAREAARRAYELDALYLKLGHFDKTLTPDERAHMKSLGGIE